MGQGTGDRGQPAAGSWCHLVAGSTPATRPGAQHPCLLDGTAGREPGKGGKNSRGRCPGTGQSRQSPLPAHRTEPAAQLVFSQGGLLVKHLFVYCRPYQPPSSLHPAARGPAATVLEGGGTAHLPPAAPTTLGRAPLQPGFLSSSGRAVIKPSQRKYACHKRGRPRAPGSLCLASAFFARWRPR